MVVVWIALTSEIAVCRALLTGLHYSLIYQGLEPEAIKRTPAQSRGRATGAYTAFLHFALGLSGPVSRIFGNWAGLDLFFFVSAMTVLTPIALRWLGGDNGRARVN